MSYNWIILERKAIKYNEFKNSFNWYHEKKHYNFKPTVLRDQLKILSVWRKRDKSYFNKKVNSQITENDQE